MEGCIVPYLVDNLPKFQGHGSQGKTESLLVMDETHKTGQSNVMHEPDLDFLTIKLLIGTIGKT